MQRLPSISQGRSVLRYISARALLYLMSFHFQTVTEPLSLNQDLLSTLRDASNLPLIKGPKGYLEDDLNASLIMVVNNVPRGKL